MEFDDAIRQLSGGSRIMVRDFPRIFNELEETLEDYDKDKVLNIWKQIIHSFLRCGETDVEDKGKEGIEYHLRWYWDPNNTFQSEEPKILIQIFFSFTFILLCYEYKNSDDDELLPKEHPFYAEAFFILKKLTEENKGEEFPPLILSILESYKNLLYIG